MLSSADPEAREKAIGHIIRIRNRPQKKPRKNVKKKVRKFVIPGIKFDAKSIDQLIDLSSAIYEPPLTQGLSMDELNEILITPLSLQLESNSQPIDKLC